jgi:hypothetical protein
MKTPVSAALILLLVGCAQAPSIQQGPDAEVTFADDPGPDVLLIVGGLHDIVSRVPPDMVGRGETYLSSVGEATLILEARDSLSGETIYRAIDRRRCRASGWADADVQYRHLDGRSATHGTTMGKASAFGAGLDSRVNQFSAELHS